MSTPIPEKKSCFLHGDYEKLAERGYSIVPTPCSHAIYHHGCPSCDRQDPEEPDFTEIASRLPNLTPEDHAAVEDALRETYRLLAPPPGEPDEGATGHIAAMERVAVDALRSKRDGYRSVIQEIADTSEDAATVRFARRALGFDEGER